MLQNYTWYTLLHTKEDDDVVHVCLVNVCSKVGGSHRILSDGGNEFKNKHFAQVVSNLGIQQIHSLPYYP